MGTVNDAIAELSSLKEQHGDIELVDEANDPVTFEFSDEEGQEAIVVTSS